MSTNRDLKQAAYDAIREQLLNCELEPGSMINEAQLCEKLGYSRTPIREAISRLEMENFIKVIPKKGIYVTDISLQDVMQIFQVRREIEPITLKLAGPNLPKDELFEFRRKFEGEEPDISVAFRLDTAMHLFIIEHCGNRFLINMMHTVFAENTRVVIASKQNKVKIHDARVEHLQILNYLIEEKYEEASKYMYYHITQCEKKALEFFYYNSLQKFSCPPTSIYKQELNKL